MDIIKIVQYVTLLELSHEDTITERSIRSNYRKLAKIYHPDTAHSRYKDGVRFRELTEAQEYLLQDTAFVNYAKSRDYHCCSYDEYLELKEQETRLREEEAARQASEARQRAAQEDRTRKAAEQQKRAEEARAREEQEEARRQQYYKEAAERKAAEMRRNPKYRTKYCYMCRKKLIERAAYCNRCGTQVYERVMQNEV